MFKPFYQKYFKINKKQRAKKKTADINICMHGYYEQSGFNNFLITSQFRFLERYIELAQQKFVSHSKKFDQNDRYIFAFY